MDLTVNGERLSTPEPISVARLLVHVRGHLDCRGVAVAVNGAVVPRSLHDTHILSAGDRVELVTAVQGG